MSRIFTTSTFARRLGFRDARDKKFRQLLKLAEKKGLIKIQQSGFKADSMHHPKIVVLMKPFEEVKFVERTVFPSYVPFTEVDGYKLVKHRTGRKRLLKSGVFSKNVWWVCEKCGKKIRVGHPYAVKVDFREKNCSEFMPVRCRCISCFLDLVEEVYGLS